MSNYNFFETQQECHNLSQLIEFIKSDPNQQLVDEYFAILKNKISAAKNHLKKEMDIVVFEMVDILNYNEKQARSQLFEKVSGLFDIDKTKFKLKSWFLELETSPFDTIKCQHIKKLAVSEMDKLLQELEIIDKRILEGNSCDYTKNSKPNIISKIINRLAIKLYKS